MLALFIIIVLVSGFIYSSRHLPSRYKMAKSDGWYLYFQVARRGTEITIFSAFLCFIIDMSDAVGYILKNVFGLLYDKNFSDIPFSHNNVKMLSWGLVTILLSYVLAWVKSRKYEKSQSDRFNLLLDIVRENPLEYFIIDASLSFVNIDEDSKVVSITLSSGKVYIGYCLGGNNVTQGNLEHIEIIPIRSGYREKETNNLVVTNNYEDYFLENNSAIDEFLIVIPTSEIISYQYFDLPAYEAIQSAPSGVNYVDDHYPKPKITVADKPLSKEISSYL